MNHKLQVILAITTVGAVVFGAAFLGGAVFSSGSSDRPPTSTEKPFSPPSADVPVAPPPTPETGEPIANAELLEATNDEVTDYLKGRGLEEVKFGIGYNSADYILVTSETLDGETASAIETIATSHNLKVQFKVSGISQAEYVQVIGEFVDRHRDDSPGLRGAGGLTADGLGVTILVNDSEGDVDQFEKLRAELAKDLAATQLTVVIETTSAGPPVLFSGSRLADPNVHYGAARIKWGTADYCTSGFTAAKNATATKVMVTASHCGSGPNFTNGAAGGYGINRTGALNLGGNTVDAQYMYPPAGETYSSRVYSGAYDTPSDKLVGFEAVTPSSAIWVTVSGSAGGDALYLVSGSSYNDLSLGWVYTVAAPYAYIGKGDSGGAVWSLHSNGEVRPRGIVVGGIYPTEPCVGGDPVRTQVCGKGLYVVDIDKLEAGLNVTIKF